VQGVSFPDGMVVLEGPEPGHMTDVGVWRDCHTRHMLNRLMQARQAAGKPYLQLYADKIYNSSQLVVAAWSKRHGRVRDWMKVQNLIMSNIRVSVEWAFGHLVRKSAFLDWVRTLKVQASPVPKYYIVAGLLSNIHKCMYGDIHTNYYNVMSPDFDEYMDQ